MPVENSNYHNLEEKSYAEKGWRWMTKRVIFPADSRDEVMRKLTCLIFGSACFYGFFAIFYAYQASKKEVGTPEWTSLVAVTIAFFVWGFLIALPTLAYVIIKKQAPMWLTGYILWTTTFVSLTIDTFSTFLYAHVTYLGLAAFSMLANLPSAPYHFFLNFLLVLMNSIRDSTDLPLRYNHPNAYDGDTMEKLIFKVAGLIFVITVPLALKVASWEEEKILAAANFNVVVSQKVAEHVLAYDTDSITKTLDSAAADIIIDEETNETQPSIVSKDLIEAFTNINKNLETWKPLLPEWCFQKGVAEEESLNVFDMNASEDDLEDPIRVSIHARRMSSTSQPESEKSTDKRGGRFQAVDKRSWEGGSDNSQLSENQVDMTNKQAAPQQAMLLKGSFLNRVIVCRLNLSRLPSFLISTYQQRNKASKKFMANTSTRFNRIMEILLETANSENGTVHTFFSDFVFVSFNATTRSSHTDIKAMRFLTTLESAVRKELTTFAADIAKENAGLRMTDCTARKSSSDAIYDPAQHQGISPQQHQMTDTGTQSVPSISKPVLESLLKDGAYRIITGAAVFGSCFGQIGGNMKRQQFILSSFSNQASFKQACAVGDKCGFVAVCKTLHQNTQQEYEFRGCSCVIPAEHKDLLKLRGSSVNSNAPSKIGTNNKAADDSKVINADDIIDGNLCHVVAATKNDGDHRSSFSGIEDVTVVAAGPSTSLSPLYELVAAKKLSSKGGDDEWLYAISSVNGANLPGHKLNDAVLSLCKMRPNEAEATLEQMAKDAETVLELPSYKTLKSMIPVVQTLAKQFHQQESVAS